MPVTTSADVSMRGPFFDERQQQIIGHMIAEVTQDVGDYALFQWQMNLIGSLKHPTGRYESNLHSVWRDQDRVVNDGWGETNTLPYGPWLEGVGSRNSGAGIPGQMLLPIGGKESSVTRFPGYFALDRAFRSVKAKVKAIGQPIVDRYMEVMNGD